MNNFEHIFPTLDCSGSPTVIPNWYEYGGSCYLDIQKKQTFPEAKAHCVSLGAKLAKITSHEENRFVTGM